MSRFLSHLSELQPEMFAEISPELARELKINNGDYVCLVSLRGAIEARALVSRRIRPVNLNGKTVHQVAVPFHFGTAGLLRGNAANDLLRHFRRTQCHDHGRQGAYLQHHPGTFAPWSRIRRLDQHYAPQSGQVNLHPEEPPPGAPKGGKFSQGQGKEGKAG